MDLCWKATPKVFSTMNETTKVSPLSLRMERKATGSFPGPRLGKKFLNSVILRSCRSAIVTSLIPQNQMILSDSPEK